jgi:hypothetical protein
MLRVKINTQLVDTSGISFTWIKKSPIFYPDEGSYSYTFTFPNTARNNKVFGFPDRLQRYSTRENTYDISISFDGITFIDDQITVRKTSKNSIEGYLTTDNGNFNDMIKGILMTEIDYGSNIDLGDDQEEILTEVLAIAGQTYPDVSCQFPSLYNPIFYGEENELNPDYEGIINLFDAAGGAYIANEIKEDPEKDNRLTLIPMFYLTFILEKIIRHFNLNPTGDLFQDTELASIVIYNNYALDRKEKKYYVRASRTNPQTIIDQGTVIFDNDYTDPNEDEDAIYAIATGIYTVSNKGYHHIYAGILVEDTLHVIQGRIMLDSDVIDMIEIQPGDLSEHSYTFFAEDADVGKSLKYNLNDGEGSDTYRVTEGELIVTHVSKNNLNQLAKTISPVNHVPVVEVSVLLDAVKKLFCAALFVDNITNEAKLALVKDIITSPFYIDFSDNILDEPDIETNQEAGYKMEFTWSDTDELTDDNFKDYSGYTLLGEYDTLGDLPVSSEQNKIARVKNLNAIYIFTVDENNLPGWAKLTDDFLSLTIGDGDQNISTEAAPLTMQRDDSIMAVIPAISQAGTSLGFATGKNDFGLHLLFYRGLQPDENNNDYPLASPVHYDTQGNLVGSYDLKWDGDNGLYETFWKDFMDKMETARTVIYYKHMSAAEIRAMDFSKKYRIRGIDYLIKELEVSISEREIQPAKLTLITI